ncbi:AAA family ATPase [Azotobacter beijerinckii]|uniref:Cobaltochelatase CobS n=1 Tax=Azotobacter beijerinckii TaxID=170623 RepID=A0A1I4GFR0_9GAMM|nr:AAA family ATPase [Azotobacter beijerinckii]SFL28835.1 cobaltochelatase CobS [Azotobacter beijerinckii]
MKFNAKVSMSEFGFASSAQAPAFEAGHEFMQYVAPKKDYFFRQELLRPLMNWLYTPCGDSALLVGPTGSGKSSLVEQLTARLNWPCLTVSAHSRMEMPELTGYNLPVTDPVSGDLNTKFVDGPLTRAMRHGFVFVLDEYDTLDPAVTVGLHAVLEGRPLVIAENGGEVVPPHPNFRFVACGNTAGQGDDNGNYTATMQQNLASLDRFRVWEVPYLAAEHEVQTLVSALPQLPEDMAKRMVQVANSVRSQHQGLGGHYLSVTLSTRTVLRWARIACGYTQLGASKNPIQDALNESLLNRCDKTQKLAITKIAQSVFGGDWKIQNGSSDDLLF